jgi:hypothetical protein
VTLLIANSCTTAGKPCLTGVSGMSIRWRY